MNGKRSRLKLVFVGGASVTGELTVELEMYDADASLLFHTSQLFATSASQLLRINLMSDCLIF